MEQGLVVAERARKPRAAKGETPVADPSGTQPVSPPRGHEGRPDPQWVRGRCPECGDDLVSNLYYIGGKGYLIRWECWGSLGRSEAEGAVCRYHKVL